MPTSSIEQRHSVRRKVKGVIKQIRKEKDQFTSAEISKICNLKSAVSAGNIIKDYMDELHITKVDSGLYEFA